MTTIQRCINQIIGASLFSADRPVSLPELDAQEWEAVYRELKAQAIRGIPESIIGQLNMPQSVRNRWDRYIGEHVVNFCQLMNAQREMTSLLDANGIPYAILKGTAAARYYPKPWLRTMGDIDFIVPQRCWKQTAELLCANGYRPVESPEEGMRHLGLQKDDYYFELHEHYSTADNERGRNLDDLIFRQLEAPESCELDGFRFSMLPELENGIVLLRHMAQHILSGLGLRQVIDWLVYVDRCLPDEKWPAFEREAEPMGLTALAKTAARLGQLYLNLRPEITWCSDADEALCAELLEYCYKSGDRGQKSTQDSQTVHAMARLRRNPFQTLQSNGLRNWKAAQKHPVLRPFAWIYQFFRYLHRGLRGKATLCTAIANHRTAASLEALVKNLDL